MMSLLALEVQIPDLVSLVICVRNYHGRKIDYFVDDQKLEKGSKISSTLPSAINKSEISLVIFSKDYADSKWCLEELEQIIHCMKNHNQIVIPAFYKVDPSAVRHQKGSYKNAFDKHCKRFDEHRLQKWKTALKETCDLSGFDSSSYLGLKKLKA